MLARRGDRLDRRGARLLKKGQEAIRLEASRPWRDGPEDPSGSGCS